MVNLSKTKSISGEALWFGEEHFKRAFEDAPIGMNIVDNDNCIIKANRAFADMLGYRAEELIGVSVNDITHPEDLKKVLEVRPKMLSSTDTTVTYEKRYVRRDGGTVHASIRFSVVRNSTGEISHRVAYIEDITERKLAVTSLNQSREQLQGILETAVDSIITINDLGIIQSSNPATEELFGYTATELIGQNVKILMPEPDHSSHDTYLSNYHQTGDAKIIGIGRETRGRRKDGTTFPMHLSVSELEVSGAKSYTGIIHNISDRVEAEIIQRRLYDAMETSNSGVALWDKDDRLVHCNEKYRKINSDISDILKEGLLLSDMFRALGNMRHLDMPLEEWVAQRIKWFHQNVHDRDFSRGPHWYHVSTQETSDGSRIEYLTDITEHKLREAALKESELRFKDFAASAADRFWEIDENYRFTYISQPTGNLGGASKSFIGKLPWEIRIYSEGDQKKMLATFESKKAFNRLKFTVREKNSDPMYIFLNAVPITNENGDFKGFRGSTTNETKEVLAQLHISEIQNNFLLALQNADIGLALWDSDEKATIWNEKFQILTNHQIIRSGITYENYLKSVAELRNFDTDQEVEDWRHLRLSLFRDKTSNRQFTLDGKWLNSQTQQLDDGSTMMFLTDITDAKNAESDLRQAQKMEAVGQLTGGIAHDFNNLLAGLQGNLDLISLSESSNATTLLRLEKAKSIVRRGAELTSRLLSFSRKQMLAPKTIKFNSLVEGLRGLIARPIGENVNISFDVEDDLWYCEVDVNQLENAILNLVLNACDAMAAGGELAITGKNFQLESQNSAKFGLASGDYVSICVKDTGHGIPADQLQNVIEPFYTTKDIAKGSGLGLSMVDGFVKQSGGTMIINSEYGAGTEVTLYFPRVIEIERVETDIAPLKYTAVQGHGCVMVIEDEPDVRNVIIEFIEASGYDVIDGGDGSNAIDLARDHTHPVELLITDVLLPNGRRGHDIAKQFQLQMPDLKVLLMTGYADDNIPGFEPDDQKYPLIRKPFGSIELLEKISDIIGPNQN